MATEHFINGKDASLEKSITKMKGLFERMGFHLEEVSWQHPLDSVFSVHLKDRDCPLLYTNGKGASMLAAQASAWGEFMERLSCGHFWSHYALGDGGASIGFVHSPQEKWFSVDEAGAWPSEILSPALHTFYNPMGDIPPSLLVDFTSGHHARGICTLPFRRLSDEAMLWFPVSILHNLYVSNGMSAGNSILEARVQALSEIIERYVKYRIFVDGLCLPDIPETILKKYPDIILGIEQLRSAGFAVLVKDASLGGLYPVVNITLINLKDRGVYASFGAHPSFGVALERTLTELLQGRSLDMLDGFPAASFDMDEVASPENIETHFIDSAGVVPWSFLGAKPDFDFVAWDFSGSREEEFSFLTQKIQGEGFELYLWEESHLGMHACRIIVPGMSEIYPIEDLAYENKSEALACRALIIRLSELSDSESQILLDTLDEIDPPLERLVADWIGLATEAGSFWAQLRIGELKAMLALCLGEEARVMETCQWVLGFGGISAERLNMYHCIDALISSREQGFSLEQILPQLYGEPAYALAKALVHGERRFFDFPPIGERFEGLGMHRAVLEAYDRGRRAYALSLKA